MGYRNSVQRTVCTERHSHDIRLGEWRRFSPARYVPTLNYCEHTNFLIGISLWCRGELHRAVFPGSHLQ
jgi:hypothetical protein